CRLFCVSCNLFSFFLFSFFFFFFFLLLLHPPLSTLFPYTTLFRSLLNLFLFNCKFMIFKEFLLCTNYTTIFIKLQVFFKKIFFYHIFSKIKSINKYQFYIEI